MVGEKKNICIKMSEFWDYISQFISHNSDFLFYLSILSKKNKSN